MGKRPRRPKARARPERDLLDLCVQSLGGTIHLVKNPDETTLAREVETFSPSVIHLTGVDKPELKRTSITIEGWRCGAAGKGGDAETNRRKNRTDEPLSTTYHDVTFAAIADLPYPVAPKQRHAWTLGEIHAIMNSEVWRGERWVSLDHLPD